MALAPGQAWLVAAGLLMAATGLRFLLEPLIGLQAPFITYFPAVLLSAMLGGWPVGTATLAGSGLAAAYLWLGARNSLSLPFSDWAALATYGLVGAMLIAMAELLRRSVRDLLDSEDRAATLAREMQHRMANLLTLAQGISIQTARTAETLEDYQEAYMARLAALGQAQRIIFEAPGSAVELSRLLRTVFDPFSSDQIALDGPSVLVPERLATSLALIMHELATNAVKYGALGCPTGRVSVTWQQQGDGVALQWREQGGPPVSPPARSGFGSRLFRTAFADTASVQVAYPADGVVCRVVLPAV